MTVAEAIKNLADAIHKATEEEIYEAYSEADIDLILSTLSEA